MRQNTTPRKPLWLAAPLAALCYFAILGSCHLPDAAAAGLLIADGGQGGVLEIDEHTVNVTINNGIAVTEVNQVFRNTEDRQVEALYTFPVPKGASVANFSMWINGKEMVGEVVEKKRAREIYESYKRVRRDPGLLDQVDYKRFEMRIFPIGPRASQRVQITYYQELDFDNDWVNYVYPLSTVTRSDLAARTSKTFALNLQIASQVPIAALESPSHRDEFVFVQHGPKHAGGSLERSKGDLTRDVVIAARLSRPKTGMDLIASKAQAEDGYFLMTLTAGEELGKQVGGMDYVFVLDVSGSMNDDGKLALSRSTVTAFVRSLGEADRFELMAFNIVPTPVFQQLREVDTSATREAVRFLGTQRARGGTMLEPALRAAFRYKDPDRPLNVVVLSDGMTEQRERRTLLRLSQERPGSTRIFCIGVGNEVNRGLLSQLARDADGLAAFVSRGDDFERQAKAFRRKLMRPAVTDLEIDVPSGALYDIEPRKLQNLYHGMPVRLYGRFRKGGPVALTLRGHRGGEMFERELTLDLPTESLENPEIERMWAWHRIHRLQEEIRASGANPQHVQEIVRLGEGFSIVTPYTSFLVLENDREYQRWKIERKNALRVERDRRHQAQVRDRLDALRKRAQAAVGPLGTSADRERGAGRRVAQRTPRNSDPQAGSRDPGSGGSGGGAFDPLSLSLVVALGGAAAAARRRKDQDDPDEADPA